MTDRNRMSIGQIRELVRSLGAGEMVVVDARDRTRTLEVQQPAKYSSSAYRTVGYHLPLEGNGTQYTLCVPDYENDRVRLRYPTKPGLGERVYTVTREGEQDGRGDTQQDIPKHAIVSDTTAADLLDCGGDLR